jgi:hypothetical protein
MPIIDVQFVLPGSESLPEGLAQNLVDRRATERTTASAVSPHWDT